MTQQEQLDLIIVTVYLISVTYVLYQAYSSLADRTTVKFDNDALEQQLEKSNLKEIVDIKFGFQDKDRFDFDNQPKELFIIVINKSSDTSIYVHWDRSTLTDYEGRSRRVIRLTSDKKPDLFQHQAFSPVTPQRSLKERITAEDLLKPDATNSVLEPSGPLIDIRDLQKRFPNKKTPQTIKELYAKFITMKEPLKLSLGLVLQFTEEKVDKIPAQHERWHTLNCDFSIRKMPRTDYLPFKF
jgi:hypothetical protein